MKHRFILHEFIARLILLSAQAVLLALMAIVVVENPGMSLQRTSTLSIAIVVSYFMALAATSFSLARITHSFTNMVAELAMISFFLSIVISISGPHIFSFAVGGWWREEIVLYPQARGWGLGLGAISAMVAIIALHHFFKPRNLPIDH
jgi:hypothetical protein